MIENISSRTQSLIETRVQMLGFSNEFFEPFFLQGVPTSAGWLIRLILGHLDMF